MQSTVVGAGCRVPGEPGGVAALGHTRKFTTGIDGAGSDARLERFMLQSVARDVLGAGGRCEDAPREWRSLCACTRSRVALRGVGGAAEGTVDIYHDGVGRAYYGGLQTCGSPWVCPVCNGLIYDYRRREIAFALDEWRDRRELPVLFITLTARHKAHQSAEWLVSRLNAALSSLYSGSEFTRLKRRTGYVGAIRAPEFTWSSTSGMHYHFHLLWFVDPARAQEPVPWRVSRGGRQLYRWMPAADGGASALGELERFIEERWLEVIREQRLGGLRGVASQVRRQFTSDEYMAKFEHPRRWGADAELAYAARKHGGVSRSRGGGSVVEHWSMFDLLRVAASCDRGSARYTEVAGVFRAYAVATRGRSSIRWSPGLRAVLGMAEEVSDAAIASGAVRLGMDRLGWLDAAAWSVVLANDCRGELLRVAGAGDWSRVAAWLDALGCPPDTYHLWAPVEPVAEVADAMWDYLAGGLTVDEVWPSWRGDPAEVAAAPPAVPAWVSRDARRSARRRLACRVAAA